MRVDRWIKFLIACSIIVAFLVIFSVFYGNYKSDNNSMRFYKQGLKLYEQGKYSDAYYNFSQIKKGSNLYTIALLKQFQAANKLQDTKTAQIKLDILRKRNTGKILKPYILYNELLYNENTGKYSKAQMYKKYMYIYKNYPDSDFAKASCIKLAKLIEIKDSNKALRHYIEYLSYAPNGKYSLEALSKISSMNTKLSDEDIEILAEAYIKNAKYKEAYKILKDKNFQNNWYNISLCLHEMRDYDSEKKVILDGLSLTTTKVDEKDISHAIDRLIKITNSNKIQALQDMYIMYKNSATFPTIAYKLAESLTSIRSIKLYEYIVDNFPNSIWTSNSYWEIFWYNYQLKRYKLCEEIALKHQKMYPNEKDSSRFSYWLGKVLLKQKKNKAAKEQFSVTIAKFPTSYYAFLSARQLKISKANKIFNKKQITPYNINLVAKYLLQDDKILLYLLSNKDYQTIDELKIDNPYLKSWVLNKKNKIPESIKIADDALDRQNILYNDYRLKLIYPVRYADLINSYSDINNLSPYLFLSLIREESHFNPNAKSAVGAVGLSQIMPSTANYIENKKITNDVLSSEEENIRIGEKYLKFLINRYNGNIYYAILSYNAGFGNVDKWISNPNIYSDEIDEFIENVPFYETKTYIKKIITSYWVYQNIYSLKYKY